MARAFSTRRIWRSTSKQAEEAKQRDHRVVGQKLGLFTIDDQVGPGLILWKPKGAMVRILLQEFLQEELFRRGYQMVYTPHIGRLELYKTSGHYPVLRRDASSDHAVAARVGPPLVNELWEATSRRQEAEDMLARRRSCLIASRTRRRL